MSATRKRKSKNLQEERKGRGGGRDMRLHQSNERTAAVRRKTGNKGRGATGEEEEATTLWFGQAVIVFGFVVLMVIGAYTVYRLGREISTATQRWSETLSQPRQTLEDGEAKTIGTTGRRGGARGPGWHVVREISHDAGAFTQGLLHVGRGQEGGMLLESTGLYGQSSLRLLDPETGDILLRQSIPDQFFAEGVDVVDDVGHLLTWRRQRLLQFNATTLQPLRWLDFDTSTGQGWGITHIPARGEFVISDGSAHLDFWDMRTLEFKRRLAVRDPARAMPVSLLNELEYVPPLDEIWANMWYSDKIARIDPVTANVVGYLDLAALHPDPQPTSREDVLNGIAIDMHADPPALYITGKMWPLLYELRIDFDALFQQRTQRID